MKNTTHNIAFVDAQNVHYSTTKCNDCAKKLGIDLKKFKSAQCTCGQVWRIDLARFRLYLLEKYKVTEAYYFLGMIQDENTELYKEVQRAGFIVMFREHNTLAKSLKKGNVDTDIVFEVMKHVIDNRDFNKILLVSGDGDYYKLVEYLIQKNIFLKILFPSKKYASSLYKAFGSEFYDYLINAKQYFNERAKEKGS
jgi:uncharacterized LabA/DUF88 family protein